MPNVCFFMVYHKRHALTKMSIADMAKAMEIMEGRDIRTKGLVIGDSYEIADFCVKHRIRHEMFRNDPLAHKMTYAFLRALQNRCEYICWYGSNNLHSQEYWQKCADTLWGKRRATFGTRNCLIMSTNELTPEVYRFTPTEGYLISSGQFFLRHTLVSSLNLLTLFGEYQKYSFDGSIMQALFDKWDPDVLVTYVENDWDDCIDVKNDVNIHSYESFRNYPRHDIEADELRYNNHRLSSLFSSNYGSY